MTGGTSVGGVIWLCGLAGVGKSTLASELARLLRAEHPNVTELDGDGFRKHHMPHAGYHREDRLAVAHALSDAAWLNAREGCLCVVSTISLFTEIHDINRTCEAAHTLPLVLMLLTAPTALLQARRSTLMRDAVNVVGLDIHAEFPDTPNHQWANDRDIHLLRLEAVKIVEIWRTRCSHWRGSPS